MQKKEFYASIPSQNINLISKKETIHKKQNAVYLFRWEDRQHPAYYTFYPLREVIPKFNNGTQQLIKTVILIRFGELGDIMALSPIVSDLKAMGYKVIFHTMDKNKPIFNWFQDRPDEVKSIRDPVLNNYNDGENTAWLDYSDTIENNIKTNWIKFFFKYIGLPFSEDKGRPFLKRRNVIFVNGTKFISPIPPNTTNNLILINRATSPNRAIALEDMYEPLKPFIDSNYFPMVYKRNCNKSDYEYARENGIRIIENSTVESHLDDLANASMVISVDTGAVHFREGIGLPALALYNAFSAKSRTEYYQYVTTYDIKSRCKFAPCFIHSEQYGRHCMIKDLPKYDNAPCLRSDENPLLYKQLEDIYRRNLK